MDPLRSSAQSITGSAYTGTYWIFMHAGGGWDPTHLCDPKGRATENEDNPMGRFLKSDIRTAGNIEYAATTEPHSTRFSKSTTSA
ncbi:MAG: hypothetical protein JRD92_19440 [Deltaproteobacteria bacterium]|nr:hypothetical protein [Deltaproteobacteria bacterium]